MGSGGRERERVSGEINKDLLLTLRCADQQRDATHELVRDRFRSLFRCHAIGSLARADSLTFGSEPESHLVITEPKALPDLEGTGFIL